MKAKVRIFAVLAAFLVLVVNSASVAVDTARIDRLRDKGVLDGEDFRIIDDFVAETVRELVGTRDFTSVAKLRAIILARNSSNTDSARAQYAEQFYDSAHKHISLGLEQAGLLTPEQRRIKVTVNLLILVDNLHDLRLVDLALAMLNDKSAVVRYWAVHCVTNPAIIEKLNSGEAADLKLADGIAEQLKKLPERSGPETLALIAEFAAGANVPQANDLLLQIADVRIKSYENWTVQYELADSTILKLLCGKLSPASPNNARFARRFAQLYSYVMQKYIRDIKGGVFLSDVRRHQLASVLVETEQSCIGKLLGMPQAVIKKAVGRGNYMTLLAEHNRLLGDQTGPGRLAEKLNFDYGKTASGAARTAPLVLPEPPKK